MRLARVDHGHSLKHKLILTMIRLTSRMRPPDILRTLFYRPDFFGSPYSALVQAVMRGPSVWSVAERELFAAFTSKLNQCLF
jgi:hypothetical protein